MNTLHFKYAVEVERTRSITQAADNLYMAQPNLSKAIKELEDILGISIFERSPKGVVPTQKGAEFLNYAKNVLVQIDKMESLQKSENSDRQCFNISIPRGSYIAFGFTNFVSELDLEKEIDVNVQETSSMQTINSIVEHQFSLGIIRYQTVYENYYLDYLADKELCYDPIWEFEYLALMSKNHPLADAEELRYSKLSSFIEIVHGDTIVPYINASEIKKPGESHKVKKRIYVYERCNQFDLLARIPATYMWVSPIPDEFLRRYELVQRKCKVANHKYKDLLIYQKGYKFSQFDKKFLDKLYESKNEVALKDYN
ncbi:MAG: LysR family transcriptional regulator [Oscillospiraceae bacterium]